MRLCPILSVACWLLTLGLGDWIRAQDAAATPPAVTPPPAGHSFHGEAFNEGPRQGAYLMGGTGQVTFPITAAHPQAQDFFNQGVGQLHGFWYFEAERSFRQVAALDSQCAMAYWGMAMANRENETRAKTFIAKAVERKGGASPREALWIDSLAGYLNSDKDPKERRRQLVRSLESITFAHPDDIEAKAFLALQIWHNSSHDIPISSHVAADALMSQVLAANPMHPIHHYRIHLWDYENAGRALNSAALCGQAAPGIAHMWHMPGHIFSRLERFADGAWQQEASARVDHAHMIRDRVLPDQIHNYAHNNEWLIQNLSHVGRVRDAIAQAKNMIDLPRHPKYNLLSRGGSSSQFGRARLFDVLLRYELWDELISLCDTPYLEPTDLPDEQIKRLRALGAALFGKGNIDAGKAQIASLTEMLDKAKTEQTAAGDAAEAKAKEEKKPDDQVAKARTDAQQAFIGRITPLESALAELNGHMAMSSGDFAGALASFEKAPGISKEFLSRAQLQAGDKAKAEQLAREAVDGGKNKVYPLANYVEVLFKCGKTAEATEAFRQLQAISSSIDIDAPIFLRLTAISTQLGFAPDWRLPVVLAADVGQRPPLDSLGPFRWQPSPAPSWSLPDPAGAPVSLSQFHGKPLVVIFYLGFGCVHCVEQLNAFGPLASEFAQAGVSVLAISTDSTEALQAAIAKQQQTGAAPLGIPLLSNADAAVFKLYRAYDDFEQQPLHATFLIDGEGLVRWQDISFDPFMDARFLLNESRRLLASPR